MEGGKQHKTKMALSIDVKSNIQTSVSCTNMRMYICTLSHTWIINNIYSQCFNVALVFMLVSLCCDAAQAAFDLDSVSPHTRHSHHTVTITHTVVCSRTSQSDMLRCTSTLVCPRWRENPPGELTPKTTTPSGDSYFCLLWWFLPSSQFIKHFDHPTRSQSRLVCDAIPSFLLC